ncbi:unnamed protein product [Rhizophagus irregularis]|nr:unnamed protein product [Rhizophagus irregularis]
MVLKNASFYVLDEPDFCKEKQDHVSSATETLTKFREDSALVNGKPFKFVSQTFFRASTRLENKVPVPIPKLLVQDQDLCKTLTCLDRYHNVLQECRLLKLDEPDFCRGTLTTWILAKITLYHPLFLRT